MYSRYIAHVGSAITATLEQVGAPINALTRAVKLCESGLIIERESKAPMTALWSSRCELHLLSESHYAYEHIARDTVDWKLTVIHTADPNHPLFVGRVERGLYEETYEQLPYEVVITAGCGLKKLADYYLPVDRLARNNKQLTSAYEVVKGCLALTGNKEINPLLQDGTLDGLLGGIYIDPDGYRTDEDGLRSSMKAGEVLEQLLSSLSLTCWLEAGRWNFKSTAASHKGTPVVLGTSTHPIEASPTLSTEAAFGSVKITLPTDRIDSAQRLAKVTLPVPECSYNQTFYFGRINAPLNHLSASKAVGSKATLPTPLEAARGMQLRLPYIKDETICICFPYRVPADAKGLTVNIDLGFGKDDISSPSGDDKEIQAVAEIMIHNGTYPILMAAALEDCWVRTAQDPRYNPQDPYNDSEELLADPRECYLPPRAPEEERQDYSTGALWGRCKEGITFTSPWASSIRRIAEVYYHGRDKWLNQRYADHLPWSKVARTQLRAGKQGTFKFSVIKHFPSTMEVHRARRVDAVERPADESDQLKYVAVYIPMRFWIAGKDKELSVFQPKEVTVGRISINYDYREERDDNSFLIADRGGSYMREGEPIALAYTTRIPNIPQPDELKGWLYDAAGERANQFAGEPLVERVAKSYFAFYGAPHDTLSGIRTDAVLPLPPSSPYTIRGRKGHTYHLAASRWDAARQEAEITLIEAPSRDKEEVQYDL